METSMNTFQSGCATLIATTVVNPIVEYLKQKGVSVSVDELLNVLNLPRANPLPQMVPSVTTKSKPSVKTSDSKTEYADEQIDGKCQYRVSRGANKGKFCGSVAVENGKFCKSCLSKAAVRKELGLEALPKKSPAKTPSGPIKPIPTVQVEVAQEMVINPYNGPEPNLYIVSANNIIVKNVPVDDENQFHLYGKLVNGTVVKQLGHEDLQFCNKLDIIIPSTFTMPAVETIPVLPALPFIPEIPTIY